MLHGDSYASVGCDLCCQHFGGACCLPLQGWSEHGMKCYGIQAGKFLITVQLLGQGWEIKRIEIEMHSLIHN